MRVSHIKSLVQWSRVAKDKKQPLMLLRVCTFIDESGYLLDVSNSLNLSIVGFIYRPFEL